MRRFGAFVFVALWVVAATTGSARSVRRGNWAPAARAAAAPVVPANGATYDAGTDFTLPCGIFSPRPDVHAVSSKLFRADPRVPPLVYPARNSGWDIEHPNKQTTAPWPAVSFIASGDIDQNFGTAPCDGPRFIQSDGHVASGTVFTLWQPGYYHVIEFDVTEHHQPITPPPFPPDKATCTDDVPVSGAHLSYINSWGDTMVVSHCRHYVNIYFTVVASGICKGVSGPPYIGAPYINQYDWGNHGGPPKDQYGDRGGNACGSSSLNAMLFNALHASRGTSPSTSIYNDTAVNPVANGAVNYFDFYKARAVLVSMGYLAARVVDLGGGVQSNGVAEENQLTEWLKQGPVLTSTTFGAGPWSTAGEGHVILFLGTAPGIGAGESPGDYIASDPAGPFFSDPHHHYGPGLCGYLARYPVTWTAAMTLNRWGLLLGPRNRVPFFFFAGDQRGALSNDRATATGARASRHTAVLIELPTGVSAWVQDRTGHRAGFVGSNQIRGLSNVGLEDEPQAPSDPKTPFGSSSALTRAPAIIALDPGTGLTLVARGRRGQRIAAHMFVYRSGVLVKAVTARAVLRSKATSLLSLPSVRGGHTSPLAVLHLTVKRTTGLIGTPGLLVSSRAPLAGSVTVQVTQGSKRVGFGFKQVKTGPFSVSIFIFPGTSGTVTVTARLVGSGKAISGSTTTTV